MIERTALGMGYGVRDRFILDHLGFVQLVLAPPAGASLRDAVRTLRVALPGATVDINDVVRLQGITTRRQRLYARRAIGWKSSDEHCRSARIGVIDTSANLRHPALRRAQIKQRSFVRPDVVASASEHGTAISILLVGRSRKLGFRGLLPNGPLHIAAVFGRSKSGRPSAEVAEVTRALDWLAGSNVDVAGLSFAGRNNLVLRFAVGRAAARGMFLVAAAGNEGPGAPPAYPAAYRSVVAVTATDVSQSIFRAANRGRYVEIAAPGVDIWIPRTSRRGTYSSGTSYAVPFIAAIAAVFRGQRPKASFRQFRSYLQRTARDLGPRGRDPVFGWGLARAPQHCRARNAMAGN